MTPAAMAPTVVDLAVPRRISGVSARTTNARESDPATAALPELWGRFARQGAPSANGPVYGVYTDYETDASGAYTTIVGRDGASAAPDARDAIIPAGRYLVFTSSGEMPAAVVAGWQQVWTYFRRAGAPARAYTTDFEQYDPATPSTVRIHIAVRGEAP